MTRLLSLGRTPYRETLAAMREIHAGVAAGTEPATWIVVEHDPVITLGRNAQRASVLVAPQVLAAHGIDLVEVERGGDATYHGPGQLVVYPIVKLERFREVVPLVSALERAVIAALSTYGIDAHTRAEHRGVYVGNRAICAVGLSIKAMTSLHGLALNVNTQLDYDRWIDPCGTPQFGITSIARETGGETSFGGARDALLRSLESEFSLSFENYTAAA